MRTSFQIMSLTFVEFQNPLVFNEVYIFFLKECTYKHKLEDVDTVLGEFISPLRSTSRNEE